MKKNYVDQITGNVIPAEYAKLVPAHAGKGGAQGWQRAVDVRKLDVEAVNHDGRKTSVSKPFSFSVEVGLTCSTERALTLTDARLGLRVNLEERTVEFDCPNFSGSKNQLAGYARDYGISEVVVMFPEYNGEHAAIILDVLNAYPDITGAGIDENGALGVRLEYNQKTGCKVNRISWAIALAQELATKAATTWATWPEEKTAKKAAAVLEKYRNGKAEAQKPCRNTRDI